MCTLLVASLIFCGMPGMLYNTSLSASCGCTNSLLVQIMYRSIRAELGCGIRQGSLALRGRTHQECCASVQVGRTGRAGNAGRVTSLYLPEQAILAEAIRAAIEAGEPIEGAFSRNRSFSKKVKKYGKYVPRGQGPQYAAR